MKAHGNRIYVSPKTQREIIRRYATQSVREIAKQIPFSRSVITRVLTENRIPLRKCNERKRRYTKISPAWKFAEKIIHLYVNMEMSTYSIAAQYDCSEPTIIAILKENNIPRRGRHSRNRRMRSVKCSYSLTQWTPDKIATLKQMVKDGACDTEIAEKLGIHAWNVQHYRCYKLGIRYRYSWTQENIENLKAWIAKGVPLQEIADRLDTDVPAVRRKKERLKLRYRQPKVSKHDPGTVAQIVKFKMLGWSDDRIAKAYGIKRGSQISNVLRFNGYRSWKLRPWKSGMGQKPRRPPGPPPRPSKLVRPKEGWTALEWSFLRKGLERRESLAKLSEALPRHDSDEILSAAEEMTRYWQSPEKVQYDFRKQRAWRNAKAFTDNISKPVTHSRWRPKI